MVDVTVTITVTDVNEAPTFGAVNDHADPPRRTLWGWRADHPENIEGDALDIADLHGDVTLRGAIVTLSLMGDDSDVIRTR